MFYCPIPLCQQDTGRKRWDVEGQMTPYKLESVCKRSFRWGKKQKEGEIACGYQRRGLSIKSPLCYRNQLISSQRRVKMLLWPQGPPECEREGGAAILIAESWLYQRAIPAERTQAISAGLHNQLPAHSTPFTPQITCLSPALTLFCRRSLLGQRHFCRNGEIVYQMWDFYNSFNCLCLLRVRPTDFNWTGVGRAVTKRL